MHLTPYYISDMIYRSNHGEKSRDGREKAHFFFKDTEDTCASTYFEQQRKQLRDELPAPTYKRVYNDSSASPAKVPISTPKTIEELEKAIKKQDDRQKFYWGNHVRETGSASAWKV